MEYPKWIYHKTHPAKIVNDPAEHESHGREWKESPAHFTEESDKEATEDIKASKRKGK